MIKNKTMLPFSNLLLICASIFILSCNKDDDNPNPIPIADTNKVVNYNNGVFITNEGPFNSGTGTLSFFDRSSGKVVNDVFNKVNSRPLGNIVQSIEVAYGKAYIQVNNSNKVEVINASNLVSIASISGFSFPQYFKAVSSTKAYVSQWGTTFVDRGIQIVNLQNNTIIGRIPSGSGPGKMLLNGDTLYLVNAGDFTNNDSTIIAIDINSDAIKAVIRVGYNPNSLTMDKNGKLWVLCGGINDFSTPANNRNANLVRIDPTTNNIEANFNFTNPMEHPVNLCINKAKDKLYYLNNGYGGQLCSMGIASNSIPTTTLMGRSFYALGIDPINDQIFASNAVNFASSGYVLRFNSNTNLIDSFQVGIVPGNFFFN